MVRNVDGVQSTALSIIVPLYPSSGMKTISLILRRRREIRTRRVWAGIGVAERRLYVVFEMEGERVMNARSRDASAIYQIMIIFIL